MDGVKLVKTLTFKRGAYDVAVQHDVVNTGNQSINPQLYLQLLRDNLPIDGGNAFYSTFTGPAFYSEAGKYQKVEFKDVDKGKASFEKQRRPTAMWPWCSTTLPAPGCWTMALSARTLCAKSVPTSTPPGIITTRGPS